MERWSSEPMPIMEVFSAALYLAHPKLGGAQGVGLLTELITEPHANFVNRWH
jgi:hypothetical protein